MQRFVISAGFSEATGQPLPPGAPSAYDLVLSDGRHALKVLLSPLLNPLVTSGQLAARCVLAVAAVRCHVDETKVAAPPLYVITAAEVHPRWAELVENSALPAPSLSEDYDYPAGPLCGKPSVYVDLYTNTLPAMAPEAVKQERAKRTLVLDAASKDHQRLQDAVSLHDLAHQHKTLLAPVICARVVKKSALQYFGGPDDPKPLPFNASLVLDDGTARVCLVLW